MMIAQYAPSDINDKLVRNLRNVSHTMRRISEGKGSQKRILMILKENHDVTQRELTEHLGIQPGSASEVIGKLEAAGLILRTPSRTDRRTTDIHLTDAGEAAASKAFAQRELRHQEMFLCLSGEEKRQLLSLLEKINLSWGRQYQRPASPCAAGGEAREQRDPP